MFESQQFVLTPSVQITYRKQNLVSKIQIFMVYMQIGNLTRLAIVCATRNFGTWNDCVEFVDWFARIGLKIYSRVYNFFSDALFLFEIFYNLLLMWCTWLVTIYMYTWVWTEIPNMGVYQAIPLHVVFEERNREYVALIFRKQGCNGSHVLWSFRMQSFPILCSSNSLLPHLLSVPVALQLWQLSIESVRLEDPC